MTSNSQDDANKQQDKDAEGPAARPQTPPRTGKQFTGRGVEKKG